MTTTAATLTADLTSTATTDTDRAAVTDTTHITDIADSPLSGHVTTPAARPDIATACQDIPADRHDIGSRPRQRGLILFGAVLAAAISTGGAYTAMVGFGEGLLHMTPGNAYSFAGVFEISLVTVALMAREAAQQARPGGVYLSLTWALSGMSGAFAASHELTEGHGPVAAAFRFVVPLLAALMWHLALVGDRHLATGKTWAQVRQSARMHRMLTTAREHARARRELNESTTPTRRQRNAVRRLDDRQRQAEAVALRSIAPETSRAETAKWKASLADILECTDGVHELENARPIAAAAARTDRVRTSDIGTDTAPAAVLTSPVRPDTTDNPTDTAPDSAQAAVFDRPRLAAVPRAGSDITDTSDTAAVSDVLTPTSGSDIAPEPVLTPTSGHDIETDTTDTSSKQLRALELLAEKNDDGTPKTKPAEVADLLGVTERTVYRWRKQHAS